MAQLALGSERLQFDDPLTVQEHFHSRGWTDGLPVVPPTPDAVEACLDWAGLSADHLVGIEPVRGRALTAEKLAINAVMAGCLPMHFPVVVTAITAMLEEQFLLHGTTASTGGSAVLLIVNGPIRNEVGMDATFNALGPSDRASTCIGRAVRLILGNLLEVRPGEIDRSTFGHPGKISWCIAEDEENSPWPSLATERLGDPPGNYAIVVPPQLRQHFAAANWSKADIQQYVFDHARIHRREWADCGKAAVVGEKGDREYAALPDPDHLLIVAAGGPAGGFGAVIPPWLGHKSRAVTVPVGACVNC